MSLQLASDLPLALAPETSLNFAQEKPAAVDPKRPIVVGHRLLVIAASIAPAAAELCALIGSAFARSNGSHCSGSSGGNLPPAPLFQPI